MAIDLMHEFNDVDLDHGNDEETITMLIHTNDIALKNDNVLIIESKLKKNINQIDDNLNIIKMLITQIKSSTTELENNRIISEKDNIILNHYKISSIIRNTIKTEKENLINTEQSINSIKIIQFNNLVKKFQTKSQQFAKILNVFDKTLFDKQMRQIRILGLNDNDLNIIKNANYDARQNIIANPLQVNEMTGDNLLKYLSTLEDKHRDILQVEQSIKELHILWQELNTLVIDQGMIINNIQANVSDAKDNVTSGVQHLKKGEENQKKARKYRCFCLLCLLVFGLIIVAFFLFR